MKKIVRDKQSLILKPKYQLAFMALPFMILLFMFAYVPILGWILAFFEYSPGIPLFQNEFVGLKNFVLLFSDSVDMLRVMKNTIIFALLSMLITPLPMFFAILLNEITSSRYKRIVQTFSTLPHFISYVIIYSLAFAVFSTDGVMNLFLIKLGIISEPTNVLGNGDAVYWFQTLISVWKGIGWGSIVYLAAIVAIPKELYESAHIDGANKFHTAIYITLPNLMNTYIVLLILQIGNFINVGFERFLLFRNPVTLRNIEVLDLYVYKLGLINQDYSYSTAIGIFKSLVSLILIFGANKLAKKVRGYGII